MKQWVALSLGIAVLGSWSTGDARQRSDFALLNGPGGDTSVQCGAKRGNGPASFVYFVTMTNVAAVPGAIRVTYADNDFVDYLIPAGASFSFSQAAGGTKNVDDLVKVTAENGAVLGSGRGRCGDIHNAAGPAAAVDQIVAASNAALDAAGVGADDLAAAGFSLAGADWPEDFAYLADELRQRLPLRAEPEVVNDAVGGLRSGSEDMIGVSVVIGTHVAIAGRNAGGDLFHLGFWPDSTGAHALRRCRRAPAERFGPAASTRAPVCQTRNRRERSAARPRTARARAATDRHPLIRAMANGIRRKANRRTDGRSRRAADRNHRHHASRYRCDGQPHRDLDAIGAESGQSSEPRQPFALSDRTPERWRHAGGGTG